MKIRLIEPAPAHLHMWSYTFLPRLGLPLIGAGLKAAGHDVVIYCPQFSPIDWDDLLSADLVGISTTTSTAPAGYEIAARVREHGVPTIVGGSHVTFMADEALAHADYVARGEGGDALMLELIDSLRGRAPARHHRRPLVHARRRGRPQPARARRARTSTRCRCRTSRSSPAPRAAGHHADHDQLGLPLRLQLLLGHGDVRAQVPLPQPRAHHGRDRGQAAESIFFYDDNFAADKRRLKTLLRMMIAARPQDPVVGAGAHRRGRRPRAPRADARLRLRPRRARPRVGEPGDPRRLRQVAERRRHRPRPRHAAQRTASRRTACSCSAPTATPPRPSARRPGSRASTTSARSCSTS